MTTKIQPSVFTFQLPLPAKKQLLVNLHPKQYPAVRVNPLILFEHICSNRTSYSRRILSVVAFLSSAETCTPSKALPFLTQKQLRTVGVLFLCILGKKAVPESEPDKEANHAITFLGKADWNSSDRCVFESARVECLQMMRSISSRSFSSEDQSRITEQLMRSLPSRSVEHLTKSNASMEKLSVALLAHIFIFVGPRSFRIVIPKVSREWLTASAFPLALGAQKKHRKREIELLAELMKNLKDTEAAMTADKMGMLFAKSPFHCSQYRFEYLLREQVPKVGKQYPDFFEALKKGTASCENVANMNQIIWSVSEKYELAKIALVQGAADAFEKEMRAPIQLLLPKDPG